MQRFHLVQFLSLAAVAVGLGAVVPAARAETATGAWYAGVGRGIAHGAADPLLDLDPVAAADLRSPEPPPTTAARRPWGIPAALGTQPGFAALGPDLRLGTARETALVGPEIEPPRLGPRDPDIRPFVQGRDSNGAVVGLSYKIQPPGHAAAWDEPRPPTVRRTPANRPSRN